MAGPLIAAVAALVLVVVFYVLGVTAKRSYVGRPRPRRVNSFHTDSSPAQARAALLGALGAAGGRYALDEDHVNEGLLTMSTRPSLFTYGFFLPVYFDAGDEGGTDVVVGCASKVIQFGPVVTHHHRQATEFVETAIKGRATV